MTLKTTILILGTPWRFIEVTAIVLGSAINEIIPTTVEALTVPARTT